MKKLSLLGILAFGLVGAYFLFSPKTPARQEEVARQKPKKRNLFLGKRTQKKTSDSIDASTPVEGCSRVTSQLEKIDLNDPISEWVSSLEQANLDSCVDPEYQLQIKEVKKVCLEEVEEDICQVTMVALRSLLRTKGIEDSDDKEMLADLILSELTRQPPDFSKLEKFADKLMKMDPDQLAFQKLWGMSKVIGGLSNKEGPTELAEEIYEKVDPELWEDPKMQGLELALRTGFEPMGVEKVAREILAEKDDSYGHEILGWSLWRQGRRDEAIQELERALQMSPDDHWLSEQYERVTTGNPREEDYQARLSLGVELRDMFD